MSLQRVALILLLLAAHSAVLPPAFSASNWKGQTTPHDKEHLVVLTPGAFRDRNDKAVKALKRDKSPFGKAVSLLDPVQATVDVRHKGAYSFWLHLAQTRGIQTPVVVELLEPDRPVATGRINEGKGGPATGGPVHLDSYLKTIIDTTRDGREMAGVLGYEAVDAGRDGRLEDDEWGDDILAAELDDLYAEDRDPFVNGHRLERRVPGEPWTWWHAFDAELEPGRYTLVLSPDKTRIVKKAPPVVDVAFLSTDKERRYPFVGDFDAQPGTFVRFRIDKLPRAKPSVTISFGMRTHSAPWGAGGTLGSTEFPSDKPAPHTRVGTTRWYRLQDIENVPGGGEVGMGISVAQVDECRGASQFATFPHPDYVVREFDWHEPDGRNLSINLSLAPLGQVRTARDHARHNYEVSLAATGERLFPLTRGRLSFGNAAGNATGAAQDYMWKTLRLLGFTAVAATDPVPARKFYGWQSFGSQYWPPVRLPFDEDKTRAFYDKYYSTFFKDRELYEGVRMFQACDEPGEMSRAEMTTPFWLYGRDDRGGAWHDVSGGSEFRTQKTDYQDCVFEGKFQPDGRQFGIRISKDNTDDCKEFGSWTIGLIRRGQKENLVSRSPGMNSRSARPGATLGGGTYRFKVIYEERQAALYLNDVLMSTLRNLPDSGGFAVFGPQKWVWDLQFRPIRHAEHIVIDMAEPGAEEMDDILGDLEDDFEEDSLPDWAEKKPVKQAIEEDWTTAGGMPGAHQGFRLWLKEKGMPPSLFGKTSYDDIRIMTLGGQANTAADRRLYYWSRRYSGYLTPRMFSLCAEAINKYAPNPNMESFVALSGHALYMGGGPMPLDMFELAAQGGRMMGGCSDYMTSKGWWWDSHETVAFTAAFYNAGGRNYRGERISYPMMHCAWPTHYRSYTMLANQVKHISYFWYGPSYACTECYWGGSPGSHKAVSDTANRAAQIDDIISDGEMRRSRVGLLYTRASEYWKPRASWRDKRVTFLALSHDYFKPEMLTGEQLIEQDALAHYDALYVLDENVEDVVQEKISAWVKQGGLLWSCAGALARNEYNEPADLLEKLGGLKRTKLPPTEVDKKEPFLLKPVKGVTDFEPYTPHWVSGYKLHAPEWLVKGTYSNGESGWIEKDVGKGRIVYAGHRPGVTYGTVSKKWGAKMLWDDNVRGILTQPLFDKKVEREVVCSIPEILASPITSANGTAVVLFNLMPRGAIDDVKIGVKQPQKPHSVQVFDGLRLVESAYEHSNDRVWVTIPRMEEWGREATQIIVIRDSPAPPDNRIDKMKALALKNLSSTDPRAVTAGAWFAGFFPEWNLGPRLVPLVKHKEWTVRRAAVESLSRLNHKVAADALATACGEETDSHALGDMLVALAKFDHPETAALCRKGMRHKKAFARRQALKALAILASPDRGKVKESLRTICMKAAKEGSGDPDPRVHGEATRLRAIVDPRGTETGKP